MAWAYRVGLGAADWSPQGFVAHASHALIVVTDPVSLQTLQVLDGQGAIVVRLKWYGSCILLS